MARLSAFLAAQLSVIFTHSGAMDDIMKGLSRQLVVVQPAFCGATTTRLSWSTCHFGTISSSLAPRHCRTVQHCLGCLPNWDFWQCRPLQALHIKQPICCCHVAGEYRSLAAFAFLYIASCLRHFLSGDHTFCIAKYIRSTDGTQSHLAQFSIRKEYMQILAYYFTHTT